MYREKTNLYSPQFTKIVLSSTFILLAIVSYHLANTEFTIYSLYLYKNIPEFVLLSLIFVEFIGILFILISTRNSKNSYILYCGFLLIISCNILVIFLPYIQGYVYPSGGDHLSHIGYVKDILIEHEIPHNLVYPMIHILLVEQSLIMNISVESVVSFVPPTFYLLFLLFTGLLAKLYTNNTIAIFSTLSGTVLFCYYYVQIFPMGFSFILYPLFFYLYVKQKMSINFKMIFLVFLLTTVFFHPVFAFMTIVMLFVLEIGYNIIGFFSAPKKICVNDLKIQTIPMMLIFIILLLWIWNFYGVWHSFVSSFISLVDEELFVKPMTSIAKESFSKLEFTVIDIFLLFVKKYGHIFVYFLLATSSSLIIIYNTVVTKTNKYWRLFPYSLIYIFILIVWLLDYVRPLTSLTSGRLIWLMISLFPLLVGFFLSEYLMEKSRYGRLLFMLFIIVSVSFIGIFSIHSSPIVNIPNSALSQSSINGPIWLLQHGNNSISVIGAGAPELYRVSSAKWGSNHRIDLDWESKVIDHFGYRESNTLGSNYNSTHYLILRPDYLLDMYSVLFPTISRYEKDDFFMLNNDISANSIYDNGRICISRI